MASRIEYGRFDLHEEADYAGIHIEVGQQHLAAIFAAELYGRMTGDGGGSAATLGDDEAHGSAAQVIGIAEAGSLAGAALQRTPEIGFQGRVKKLVNPGAQRRENRLRVRRGMQRHQHDVGYNGPDLSNHFFQGFPELGDLHHQGIGTHALDPIQERPEVGDVLLLDEHTHWKVGNAGLHGLPEFFGFYRQTDSQRVHSISANHCAEFA